MAGVAVAKRPVARLVVLARPVVRRRHTSWQGPPGGPPSGPPPEHSPADAWRARWEGADPPGGLPSGPSEHRPFAEPPCAQWEGK